MRVIFFGAMVLGVVLAGASSMAAQTPQQSAPKQGGGEDHRGYGMGGFPGGGRGILGSVTEVTADHYKVKTEAGETYVVHFSVNTRILKQGAGGPRAGRHRTGDSGPGDPEERPAPQILKPTDIQVGDFITAGGEVDTSAKSVGAIFIIEIDPERARQMRQMEADFGKTWLAGRITGIEGTTITIEGFLDHAVHSIVVDENTSFRKRRESITLADIQVGQQLRAEGAPKSGAFLATVVTAAEPPNRGPREEGAPDGTKPQ